MSTTLEQFDEETRRMVSISGSAANIILFNRGAQRVCLAEKLALAENAKDALEQNTAFQQAYARTVNGFLRERAENAKDALEQKTTSDIAWRIGAFAAGVCVALLITRLSL